MVKPQSAVLDRVFHALAHPARRLMLRSLASGERSLTELAAPLRMSFPAASKHVRVLERAKLVRRRLVGRTHVCRIEAQPSTRKAADVRGEDLLDYQWTVRRLLAALHIVKSDVDPSWHFISEYAIGKHGWLLQAAFVSLAIANLATWAAIRQELQTVSGKVGSSLFLVGTCGLLWSAVCIADPMNTPVESQTTSGNLHNLGGALGLLGFAGTLTMSVRLLRSPAWRSSRPVPALREHRTTRSSRLILPEGDASHYICREVTAADDAPR